MNHVSSTTSTCPTTAPFWLLGDNAFCVADRRGVWRLWPFAFLMLMAGLQSIPDEVYEAAAVDGAGTCGSAATSRCPRCAR